jgi:ABC-type lipoprotein release transport system permease subunit
VVKRVLSGLQHAGLVVGAQVALLHLLAVVPAGTQAQVTGVAVSTLALLFSGFLLGFRFRHGPGAAPPGSQGARRLRDLRESMAPWKGAPWPEVVATALVLAVVGLLAQFAGVLDAALPAHALGEGGMARAAFAADTVGGFAYVSIGAMLGVNHRPGATRATLLGLALFAGVAGAGTAARYLSYDPGVIAALMALALLAAAWITGFGVAWVRRRLAFVELVMVSLLAAYALFLLAAVGPVFVPDPEAGGLGAPLVGFVQGLLSPLGMVPKEQLLLGLAIFPAVAFGSLMTVGGSLGFLLFGGGRFDPGFAMEAQIALRYLKAQGRDGFVGIVTIIAVVGVCLGVMALIVVLSIMSGFENDLEMKILGAHAHILVSKRGDDFTEYEDVEDQVRQVQGVKSAVAFVLGDAMISTDVGLSGTVVKGVDASDPMGVEELRRIVEQGSFDDLLHPEEIPGARPRLTFPPPPVRTSTPGIGQPILLDTLAIREPSTRRVLPGILIGRELSKTLRAYVGDTVKLVSPSSDEIGPLGPTPKLRRFRVAGVFYSGMYEYDAKFTYIDMKQAQRFFGLRKEATGVEIKVKDVDETARIGEELKRRVGGHPYNVKDWRTMNKELFSALLLEKLAMFIALGMIVMVASFLIVAVLVMIVLQRRREIAILKSLGASDASVMKVFVVEGLILGVGGALLGGLIGVGICLFEEKFGVELDPRIFYIERLPVVMKWGEIGAIAFAAVIISYLATIYPAVTAALHPPVEGLRDD